MGSLSQRRHYQTLILVFKSINSLGPTYINELFKLRLVRYNLRGTGTNLEQPQFNLEWLHKSFLYIASSLWNKLPVEIRQLNDIKTFRNALYAHMFLR